MSTGHKIKVVCRIRPFLKTEKPDTSVEVEANNVLRVSNPRDHTKDVKFNFDSCYGPDIDQATIYRNDVRPLVETMFSGMSATIFCYGVTGAGKTHTIQGSDTEPGIIPRALEHIFMHQQRDPYDYDIRIRYYEIYKEAVFDLLKPHDPTTSGLPIREDAQRKIFVAGLSEKRVTSYEQFDAIYQKASGNRRTASTKLNNHSSRSHAILTVQVQWQDDTGAGTTWCGRLHLIDLAGSEDNRRTENGKDRMAESSAINRSLFVLGQVVEALNTGSSRIPYRDSKMTRILQDSLGGESLGMMIVNVAPGERFLQDTNNTLNFATKSRLVVNKPVAHEVVEQRWSAADRLQHHRGALAGRQPKSTLVVASGPGVKRRRSDEMDPDSDGSPGCGAALTSSGGLPRRPVAVARPGRHSDGSCKPGAVQRAVTAKFSEVEQKTSSASSEIMERVMRIEQQLNGSSRLDSSVVIDMFTPATKLKTSRGWLKHARELEQGGDLEKALAHYEEALKYAPELNKLEAHIEKLRVRLRRQKRRSSIASHGAANVRVADQLPGRKPDDDDDCGPLWLIDGLAESPGAEKAKRRAAHTAKPAPKPLALPSTQPAAASKAAPSKSVVAAAPKRVKLAGARKASGVTEGSVHDRRVSFGSSILNPFVVGGSDFDSDLQDRLDRKAVVSAARTKRLEAKSSVAARLNRVLAVPRTPGDRDYVPPSSDQESDSGVVPRRRVPGALGVRGLVEQRRQQAADDTRPPKQSREGVDPVADLGQFSDICQASALQMINSADVKKIMKLQGIGKRRAEQIQASVKDEGPILHVCDLQTRLHFKSKLILAILSTFA
ncbi:hypothetical protein H4218_002291 [Coemansia sp. IMI 209128]|nr:hypothetical protein H4218_002291 [Coemansia sp. IMI 209128]